MSVANSIAIKIRPRDLKPMIAHCMQKKKAMFIWAGPGVGKSDIVHQIGKETGRPVIDIRLALYDPVDMRGLPIPDVDNKTVFWAQPADLPRPGDESMANAILFLDEMNQAPQSVQAAAYQLILNRRIGDYVLPEGVDIVAAGNRETDKAGAQRMQTALANRFVHVELEVNHEDWVVWAVSNNIHPDVVGYLSRSKQDLNKFDPASPQKAFATPRSWAFASDLINEDASEDMNHNFVAGCVGEGIASGFMQYRRMTSKLPKPEVILSGEVTKIDVEDISACYSLSVSLCYELNNYYNSKEFDQDKMNQMIDTLFRFIMDNFAPEMIILCIRTLMGVHNVKVSPRELKNFKEFQTKYGKYMLGK